MAMTIKDYEERLAKAEDRLAKVNKRIQKWEDAKSDEKFAKHYEWMKNDDNWQIGWNGRDVVYGTFDEFKEKNYKNYVDDCDHEIKYANRDKEEILTLIDKYKNAINLLKEKDAKPVIQIFKDFFNNWKQEIIEYVTPLVDEYYETDKQLVKLARSRYDYNIENGGFASKEEFDAAYKELRMQAKDILSQPFVKTAVDKSLTINDTEFNKYLDDYMNDRYFDLVDKVVAIVGEINDVSNLRVGIDGGLNGKIYGDKGGAKIETIVAGGYNTDIIVNVKHGQIRHYRVLVHPIK